MLFLIQGGAISILTACERPNDFAGVVLIAPMVQMNPDSATPFKVPHNRISSHSLHCSFILSFPFFISALSFLIELQAITQLTQESVDTALSPILTL